MLVDGGRGQLASVERALTEAGAPETIELAAISKGATRAASELGDLVWRPGRKNPSNLRPGSSELLYLQRIRDAAHTFVIGRQRRARSKRAMQSRVEAISGVGPKTARLLWDRFGSLAAMAKATRDELAELPGIGVRRAATLHEALGELAGRESGGEG
jgi:excinuclease ABC subunit C